MSRRNQLYRPAYFITLCAFQSQPHLGSLTNGLVELTEAGRMAEICWQGIPDHVPEVHLDAYVVMPNHFHGILMIDSHSPQPADPHSLSAVIRSFKAAATNRVNHLKAAPGASLWQPSYHARLVKTRPTLVGLRQYIRDNPRAWLSDPLNPEGERPAPFCPVPLNDS